MFKQVDVEQHFKSFSGNLCDDKTIEIKKKETLSSDPISEALK